MLALRSAYATALIVMAGLGSAAQAADYKSVGPGPAVLYDAPGLKSRKVFIAPAGMPLEVVISNGDWSRVRDVTGDLSWIESKALQPKRTLIVEVPQASAHAAASETSAVVYTASKGVILELAEPIASGWIKLRHRDGETGFVKASEVWGE